MVKIPKNMDEMDAMSKLRRLLRNRYERPGDVFASGVENGRLMVAPGVYNPMGAYAAKQIYYKREFAGKPCVYKAVYFGGWSASAMLMRRPDMSFVPRHIMEFIGQYVIEEACPLPVIMDAETGFALEPVAISETVKAYHKIGVALAHLEDQATRRCGNLGGKACISIEDMVAKIKFWLSASEAIGTSMRLMARTDALTAAGGGLENAIERGKYYMDVEYGGLRPLVLWADAMYKPEDLERWTSEMKKHDPQMVLGINYSPNKDWTGYYRGELKREPPTFKELHDLGFQVIWHTILQARADMESTWNVFDEMAEKGPEALWNLHERQRNHPVGDAQGMSGAREWQAYDQFIGGEEAAKRYEKSEGYGK